MYLSVHPDIIHRINCCSVEPTSDLEYPLSLTPVVLPAGYILDRIEISARSFRAARCPRFLAEAQSPADLPICANVRPPQSKSLGDHVRE